jgi:GMP synthase-like glutamine amidotransferase
MYPIYIIRHSPLHGSGYLLEVLQRHLISCEICPVDSAATLLANDPPMSALVLPGGPFDIHNENLPWLEPELQLIKRAIDRHVPLLGHGLGAEMIAAALDARVVRSLAKQVGWFSIQALENDTSHRWLDGLPSWLEVFKWHGQSFDLPTGAQPLMRSDWSPTEAFALDNILAFEGHLEVDRHMLQQWLQEYSDEVAHPQPDPRFDRKLELNWDAIIQGPEMICSNLDARLGKLHQAADLIYGRWLECVR